jgi:tetratricopeptide (TPR) repeat protein
MDPKGGAAESRFLVALSFPGEKRDFVGSVADHLSATIGPDRVFYDRDYEADLARPNLDTYLQEIYKNQSALVVPFFCQDYEKKKWCNVEWRSIRVALRARTNDEKLMVMRFDNTPIPGFLELDGYVDIGNRSPEAIADLILQRLKNMGLLSSSSATSSRPSSCIHNLPFPSIGDLMKGRKDEMQKLMKETGATAITQAIHGLGGIGKSRLAVELGWHAVNDKQHNTVLFVIADTSESLRTNLAALTEALSLPEKDAKEQEIQYKAVLNWFERHDGWLLIFDNVDTDEAAEKVLALFSRLSRGRVLITSRKRGWPPAIHPMPLEKLTASDAVRFLLDRTYGRVQTNHDESDAQKLAQLLDGLPLALEQAAAYIDARSCTFADYLKDWEQNRSQILSWHAQSSGIPVSVAITWNRTWEILSPAAQALLRLVSYLAPEPIPIDLLEKNKKNFTTACKLLENYKKTPVKINAQDIISELARYSMIERGENTISVHRIVQEVIRMQIPKERERDWVQAILNIVDGYFPGDPLPQDVRSWNRLVPMQSHVSAIIREADKCEIEDPPAWLMNELSIFLSARAAYAEAEPLKRRVLKIFESSLGTDHPEVAAALNNLAQLLQDTNRLKEAEPLMRRALQISETALGPNHPDVAIRLNNLAQLLQATNRLQEAEPLMRRALQIDETSFGTDHPNVARDLNNLAQLLQATNRLQEAEPLMRRALQIDETSFGTDHPKVAIRLNNLASIELEKGNNKEAKRLFTRALKIFRASFDENHPSVQTTLEWLNNLRS